MSKLRIKYTLTETELLTDKNRVRLKVTPRNATEAVIQFGHSTPSLQIADAADLRELADIFLEVAELLEGENQALKKATELEEKKHTVHVKVGLDTNGYSLHGVFSDLTDKQAEDLRNAVFIMDRALPQGIHFWAQL